MWADKSLFKTGFFSSKKLTIACIVSFMLVALVLFTPIRIAFGLEILSWQLYLIGLALATIPLIVMEISKAIKFAIQKKRNNK